LATQLCQQENSVLIAQDPLMAALYPENRTIEDYLRTQPLLRNAIKTHIIELLKKGMSVILDFPANTKTSRLWMRDIFTQAGSDHILHFLDTPDDICRQRMHARNAANNHEYKITDAQFDEITAMFVTPSDQENFNIMSYTYKS